nr:photosystem II protein I [Pinus caribaea]YP_010529391.1 photosystem II protein I [Pinus caribaea]UXW91335.1 photosystem II protein I [Pinus caribaea]UXW91403.1 photosystem II protein I [Pinus caribaea]
MTDFFCFSWPGHRPGQEKQKKSVIQNYF